MGLVMDMYRVAGLRRRGVLCRFYHRMAERMNLMVSNGTHSNAGKGWVGSIGGTLSIE